MMGDGGTGPGMMGYGGMGPRMMANYGPMMQGRLAYLKAELGITDAQKAEWDGYVDASSVCVCSSCISSGLTNNVDHLRIPMRLPASLVKRLTQNLGCGMQEEGGQNDRN